MKSYVAVFGLLTLTTFQMTRGYKVCGDATYKPETSLAIKEIVKRLMAMRNTNYNWQIIQTPMLMQLVAPEQFYERNKTIEALRMKLKNEADTMSLQDLAMHTIAVKGLCENNRNFSGMDLPEMVKLRLKEQFGFKVKEPKDGMQAFSIGLSALCISDYPVRRYFVNKWLANQNKDGSFGTKSGDIEPTVFSLSPMFCIAKEQNQNIREKRLENSIKRMRKFLISQISTNDKNQTYLGNPATSLLAISSLLDTRPPGEEADSWKCSELMDTLGTSPGYYEPEILLAARLIRISGRGFGLFKNPEWKCAKPDPTPHDYVPTCEPSKPGTCGTFVMPPNMGMPPGMMPPNMGMPPGMMPPNMGIPPGMMPPDMGMPPGMMPPDMGMPPGMMPPGIVMPQGGIAPPGMVPPGMEMPQGVPPGVSPQRMMPTTSDGTQLSSASG